MKLQFWTKVKLKMIVTVVFSGAACLVLAVWLFMQQPAFGRHPFGARLERIKQSPVYKDGKFRNTVTTPSLLKVRVIWP